MASKKRASSTANVVETKQESKFNKAQILKSKKYIHRRDVLSAILSDKEEYTISQIDSLLEKFMKGKVK